MSKKVNSDSNPTVSVVIPTYNRADILPRAVDSVLGQTYEDFELFVVDDASTDETPAVAQAYEDDRLRYIQHEKHAGNGGITRNTALERVSGEYVAFLDDDDEWLSTKLEKQVAVIEDVSNEVALVYCWMDYYDGDTVVEHRHPELRGDIFREMLDRNAITAASTLLVRTEVARELDGFDDQLLRGIDSDFIRRITYRYHVEYVPEALVKYNIGHEFNRDTTFDEAGIRKAIKSAHQKYEKFPEAFERYPEMAASNLGYIGCQHFMLGEWATSARYYGRAIRTEPLSWRPYFQMARGAKFYVDRYIPMLGKAIDVKLKR